MAAMLETSPFVCHSFISKHSICRRHGWRFLRTEGEPSSSLARQEEDQDQQQEQPASMPPWLQAAQRKMYEIPPLRLLQKGEPSDVLRLGVVAYAGFAKTSEYQWLIPQHAEDPVNTINYEREQAVRAIENSRGNDQTYVYMVIRDAYDPDETSKSGIPIPVEEATSERMTRNSRVIVGLAVWKLSNSVMHGRKTQLRCDSNDDHSGFSSSRAGTMHFEHHKALQDATDGEIAAHIGECGIELKRLVVHPAYQKKGHGKVLVEWGMELANLAEVDLGVDAAASAKDFYGKLGFETVAEYQINGDNITPDGYAGSIMRYTPLKA